jgi:hypothetical protein
MPIAVRKTKPVIQRPVPRKVILRRRQPIPLKPPLVARKIAPHAEHQH